MFKPVLIPGPTIKGCREKYLRLIFSRECISGGTTEEMATALIWSVVRPLSCSMFLIKMPSSSSVLSRRVAIRQQTRTLSPWKTPSMILVLPTSMASSITFTPELI